MTYDPLTSAIAVPAFDSTEQEVFLQLWRTYDRLKAIEDELFSRFDLTPQQYNALRLLDAAQPGGVQTMELGRRLISRMPDTTRMVDRLEQRGLVSRRRLDDNRRVVELRISPQGQLLLKEMAGVVIEMHRRQLGHLGPRQQQQLVKLLRLARQPHEDDQCDWLET
jgi:DNA-binding MarR family transcriptional regulator